MSQLQKQIDDFLRVAQLRTVIDLIFFPGEMAVVVIRRLGYRNVTIDLDTDSPEEAMEILKSNPAVY